MAIELLEFPKQRKRQRKLPFHEAGSNRLVEVIRNFSDGTRLTKVEYVWPCWNCRVVLKVDFKTFNLLETKMLLGIKCPRCLNPSPESGLMRNVA